MQKSVPLKACQFQFPHAKAFDHVDHNKMWKTLQEIEISDHLTFLLRNLYAGQEATVSTGHGTMNWLKIGKQIGRAHV